MPDDEVQMEKRVRLDVFHHFPDGIPITVGGTLTVPLGGQVAVSVSQVPPPPLPATHASLTIKEPPMPATISLSADDQTATAVLTFEDRLDDTTGPPLSSDGATPAVVAYSSDNDAVATVDATSGLLTFVSAGTFNLGATVDDAITGNPVLEPDGVTPFAPAAINVTVTPGVAVQDTFTVTP